MEQQETPKDVAEGILQDNRKRKVRKKVEKVEKYKVEVKVYT